MNLRNELEPNTNPAEADTRHLQNVLDTHAAGRLVTVLTCEEAIDGAVWTALVRATNGNLQRVDVCSEPGYSDVDVCSELS